MFAVENSGESVRLGKTAHRSTVLFVMDCDDFRVLMVLFVVLVVQYLWANTVK